MSDPVAPSVPQVTPESPNPPNPPGPRKPSDSQASPVQGQMNAALKACKFGRFQFRLLISALISYMYVVLVGSHTGYVVTAAECDLNLDLTKKGILIAMPYIGMLVSSLPSGILSDMYGRKIFLNIGFGGCIFAQILAGTSQSFAVLVTANFLEGLLFAVSYNPLVTLTSEYTYPEIRDRVMTIQTSFLPTCMILAVLFTWPIMVQNWQSTLFGGSIVLNIWNFYIYACAIFPIIAFISYQFIPESPKYLLKQKKYDEARAVLVKVYTENTRKPVDTFQYKDIFAGQRAETVKKLGCVRGIFESFRAMKPMFRPPYRCYLSLVCTMNWLNMLVYNVLRLWYPQISTIVERYDKGNSTSYVNFCQMLDEYTKRQKIKTDPTNAEKCVPKKCGTATFLDSLMLGVICVIPFLVNGFLISRIGKRRVILICSTLSFVITVVVIWIPHKTVLMILFSVDVALTQAMLSIFQLVVVKNFPTDFRTSAVAMMMTFGRLGTLFGNIIFPILLEYGCTLTLLIMASAMAGCFVLGIFLPSEKPRAMPPEPVLS